MKKVLPIICAVACIATLVAPAWSQSDLPQVSSALDTKVDMGYASQYVWRGIQLNEDAVVQPSLTITNKHGLSFNFFGNMDTTNIAGQSGDFTRINYTVDYAWKTAKNVGFSAGLATYTYPSSPFVPEENEYALSMGGGGNTTNEVYFSATLPVKFAPKVAVNYDYNEADGLYATVGAGYKMPLSFISSKLPVMNLAAQVGYGTAGYNDYYYAGSDKSAFTDGVVSASFPIQVSDIVTITPAVTYTRILDKVIRDNMVDSGYKANNFYMGVTTSFSF